MLRIEPYLLPRDLMPARLTPRRGRAPRLRVAPTVAPRLRPTWAPQGSPDAIDWEAVLAVRIPKAPPLPADLAGAFGGDRATPTWDAALAEVSGVLGDLGAKLRAARLQALRAMGPR
jgi:hypothetical protein